MIDKNELLKILPKLIREDDEIKGAIITALSGVVATKDDIARLIEHSDRRFEAMQEQMDKRFLAVDYKIETTKTEIIDGIIKVINPKLDALNNKIQKVSDDLADYVINSKDK